MLFPLTLGLLLFATQPGSQQIQAQTTVKSSSVSQAQDNWQRYILSGAEFSVLLPTVPAMSSYRERRFPASNSPLRHIIGAYSEGVVYAIRVFERKQSLQEFIDYFGHSSANNFKRDLNVSDVRGKEYASAGDGIQSGTTYFITERQIYVFEAQGSSLGYPAVGIPKFFNSIRFDRSPDGLAIVEGVGNQPPMAAVIIEGGSARPVSGKEATRKSIIITKPEPTYTDDARQNAIAGAVVLRVVFSSTGAVTSIRVMSGLPHGLTEKAIDAARQIKFIPAVRDGHFVSMFIQLQYNFNLY